MSTQDFAEKVVLITGASSGIGSETAKLFASQGAHLVLTGRKEEQLNQVAEECRNKMNGQQQQVHVLVSDQSETEAPKKLVDFALEKAGKIDVVVSSAGILTPGSIETLTVEQYDTQMNINTRAVFLLLQAAVPHLLKTKGSIVVVSSVTGIRAFPGVLAYNVSKAAVDQMVRTVALELAARGVRCNAVNPGVIVTEVHKRGGMNDDAYAKFLEHSKTTHAMGRVGTVDEVAQAISFLANDKTASFITGQTLSVDGGRSVMCPR